MEFAFPMPLSAAFFGLLALAGVAVLQFYRGRRKNLEILEKSIRIMEEALRPRDKNYTVIGLYVGYSARYLIDRGGVREFEATVLLLPRQSLFYIPIAKITSRFDRVYLIFRTIREPYAEAHLVRKGYYRMGVKRVIRGIEKMTIESIDIDGKRYFLVYTSKALAKKLLDFAKSLDNPHVLNHVAIVSRARHLYIAARLDLNVFSELLRKSYRLASEIA